MNDISIELSIPDNIEKRFKYDNDEWKLMIEPSIDFFNLNIIHSYHTYQNTFYYKYQKELFKSVNNVNDIINMIIKTIEENEFKIEEDNKNLILKLSPNIIFNLKRKENRDIIDILIEEIKLIREENISIKESINIVYEELQNKNKEIEDLKGKIKILEDYHEENISKSKKEKKEEEKKPKKKEPNTLKKNFKTLKNHTGYINHLSKLNDGRLASCSDDCNLNIYKKESFELQISIKPHSDWIYSFTELSDGRIITCFADKTMKIIKLIDEDKYKIEQTLKGHNDCVLKVIEIRKNELISISKDNLMKVWILNDNNEFNCITNIPFQKSFTYSNIQKLNKNQFVTSSVGDKSIKFWNGNNYTNITTINDIETDFGFQTMCLLNDNLLCVGGTNSKGFYLININNHQVIKNILGSKYIYSIYKCFNGEFLCSIIDENWNNSLVKYKFEKENLMKFFEKEKAHDSNIFSCVELNDGTIASGGSDKLIKLWSS